MAAVVEKYNDIKGICWPEVVAPFQVHLVALPGKDAEHVFAASDKLYADLVQSGIEVLYDDRADISAGEKFADSDLIGIPFRVVVSAKTIASQTVELKKRASEEAVQIKFEELQAILKQ
jgi:prolyl-tRNA synthetase